MLPAEIGASATMRAACSMPHPYAVLPPLDPLLARALQIAVLRPEDVRRTRACKLARWCTLAAAAEEERESWLRSLPTHVASVFGASRFNGPLFGRIHRQLVSLGYPDTSLFDDVCKGMPSGGVLPISGLWVRRPATQRPQSLPTVQSVYDAAPANLDKWTASRRPDAKVAELIERNEKEVSRGRRAEVPLAELRKGSFVAHPEFMSVQRDKSRACSDCTESGWNSTIWSGENCSYPGVRM